ncbi:hypothetical protein [Flavobacterium sp.]|uniref:hypothetical protein n=1 Tax=Flavobacterium sp. TaxID=239 RepID=UPI0025DE659A|nr:hypothetical protein [Flavobacterium sp.]
MKIIKSLFAFATYFSEKSLPAPSLYEKWTDIKAYQEIIAKTFQNKEVNLKLIKSNSKILVEHSDCLSVESMPQEFRNPKLIKTLLILKKNTKVVHELVEKKASDSEIKMASDVLIDTFYKITELCSIVE